MAYVEEVLKKITIEKIKSKTISKKPEFQMMFNNGKKVKMKILLGNGYYFNKCSVKLF